MKFKRSLSILLMLLGISPLTLGGEPLSRFDLVLRGGTVLDGTGQPPFRADIALRNGRIVRMGSLSNFEADRIVDVSTQTIVPGFIDILRHNDLLWSRAEQERAIREGITSGLAGNCGFSVLDVKKNLAKLDKIRGLLNLGTLIGQGSVRDWFVKGNRNRAPSGTELAQMRTFVSQALEAGAFGLSSGLGYEPGLWCQPRELENLASVLPRYPHAAYYTHIRNYRSGVLEAISEAVQVGKKTGVPVVIQHLLFKLPSNWDQTERGLNLLEESRAQGLKLYATVYPYDFWGNEVQIPLFQFLYLRPEMTRWSYYRDPSKYDEVLALIHRRLQEYGGGEKVEITKARSRDSRNSLGHTLGDLAKRRKMSEDEVVVSLLLENGEDLKICYHGLSEEGLIKKIQSPFVLFGSDSTGNISHPRDVGSFPRLLGNYVRDKKVIRLSEAVARLTREPAALLGLKDRGELKEGNWGDVVVFDAKTIRDTATAVSPWSPPDGIRMVLVNGQVVFENASFTGRFPGQVLRRSDD